MFATHLQDKKSNCSYGRKPTIGWILASCAWLFISLPVAAYATDEQIMKYTYDGHEYVCLEPATAQRLLQIYIDFPKLELKINLLEELNFNLSAQMTKEDDLQKNLQDQIKIMQDLNVNLQKTIDNQSAWYKSPWLWFSVGVIVTSGVTIGILSAS